MAYLWVKALHIIAVISWMAGLLYLPRLFVYHAVQVSKSPASEMLKVMELRLLKYIMTPAMIVVWLSGVHMVGVSGFWREPWLLGKLCLVIAMTAAHLLLARHRRAFFEDKNDKPQKYFRIINEIPTILMILIVVLVVVRPL